MSSLVTLHGLVEVHRVRTIGSAVIQLPVPRHLCGEVIEDTWQEPLAPDSAGSR